MCCVTDGHGAVLENGSGSGHVSEFAIAMSVLSELSVSSQVHLPDNKKARWGQRAFSLFLTCCQITGTATTTRPHVRECATTRWSGWKSLA
jgi:hypothetical protein